MSNNPKSVLDMSTYSMAQVESLTGINAHTLRIWERRYNFPNPQRTETNIRFYNDDEVVKLLNVAILIRNGHRISKICAMEESMLHNHVTEILSKISPEIQDEIDALTLSMLELNEEEFDKVFRRRINRGGLQEAITNLIYPFLGHTGLLWGTKKIMPAQEHFVSNLIRQKLIAAIDSLPYPEKDAKSICMFLLEGEDHEIGLLLAAYIARDLGWKVYYLGQRVPISNIEKVLEITNSDLLLSLFIFPSAKQTSKLINEITSRIDVPFLVSGNEEKFSHVAPTDQLVVVKTPSDLVGFLERVEVD